MPNQSTVFEFQDSGIPGELYSDYPVGCDAYVINSCRSNT